MKVFRLTICTTLSALMLSYMSGCKKDDPLSEAVIGENSFIMTLYPDIAPITCENFQKLVDSGFYNGLTFHRVVDDFIAQGGDPNGDGTGASSEAITGEFSANGIHNNLSHVRGTVSMAHAEDYNSATCQFFICLSDLTYLDGSYAAFGNVTEGMEAVDKFLEVPKSRGRMGEISSPAIPIYIKYAGSVKADTAGNPRIQFLIDIDEKAATGIAASETTASSEVPTAVTTTASAEEITEINTDISAESTSEPASEIAYDSFSESASETETTATETAE